MPPRWKKAKSAKPTLNLVEKKALIDRVDIGGEKKSAVADSAGIARTTFSSIYAKKEEIAARLAEGTSVGIKRVEARKQRHPAIDKMEKLLHLWIQEMQRKGDGVSGEHIRHKARRLYDEIIRRDYPEEVPAVEPMDVDEHEDAEEEGPKGFKG
jgi:hypothetical protein